MHVSLHATRVAISAKPDHRFADFCYDFCVVHFSGMAPSHEAKAKKERTVFGLFKKSEPEGPKYEQWIIAELNARVRPLDRGEYFEDPLDEALQAAGLGEVTGGGSMMSGDRDGISFVDLEINVLEDNAETRAKIIEVLESRGAPVGSKLKIEGQDDMPFGKAEGMGIYLNGTDLPDEVYAESDVNDLIEALSEGLDVSGEFRGYWESDLETGLFFYGRSYDDMVAATAGVVESTPLCQLAKVERIA